MKVKVANYTFNKTAKQITFTDYNPILLNSVLLIVNVTDNIIIYNFADPTKGGTVATNVLTLAYDTSSMADSDKLLIYYDDPAAVEANAGNVADHTTDSGNPVKVDGKYNATAPTYADGDRADMQMDANGNQKNTLGTGLSKTSDGITARPEGATYVNLTASGIVRTGPCIVIGMYVNSTNGGTVKLWDNVAGSGTVVNNTITPAIGYHRLGGANVANGLYATIGGTALDVTFYIIPTP